MRIAGHASLAFLLVALAATNSANSFRFEGEKAPSQPKVEAEVAKADQDEVNFGEKVEEQETQREARKVDQGMQDLLTHNFVGKGCENAASLKQNIHVTYLSYVT